MSGIRGQIFLWSGTDPIARGVQFFTGSKWSHCGFVLDETTILDSDWKLSPGKSGVKKRDFWYREYPEQLKVIELPFNKEGIESILLEAEKHIGQPYDIPLIFSFIREWLDGDHAFDSMRHGERRYTCSEFIAYCIQKATGKSIIEGRPPHTIRPHEIEYLEHMKQPRTFRGSQVEFLDI